MADTQWQTVYMSRVKYVLLFPKKIDGLLVKDSNNQLLLKTKQGLSPARKATLKDLAIAYIPYILTSLFLGFIIYPMLFDYKYLLAFTLGTVGTIMSYFIFPVLLSVFLFISLFVGGLYSVFYFVYGIAIGHMVYRMSQFWNGYISDDAIFVVEREDKK